MCAAKKKEKHVFFVKEKGRERDFFDCNFLYTCVSYVNLTKSLDRHFSQCLSFFFIY